VGSPGTMSAILRHPELHLRPMTEADLSAVLAVERAAYSHPWSLGIFRDCLRVGYSCQVGLLAGRTVAHGVLSVAVGEAHLLNLCVHPDHQGQGLGRQLLEGMLGLARDHRADTVFLEVRSTNLAAQALYQSSGFNEVGRRFDYYPAADGREDAIVYAKVL